MTTEEIRAACAELMGWKVAEAGWYGYLPGSNKYSHILTEQIEKWRPDEDRNQSRMVVQRALQDYAEDEEPDARAVRDFADYLGGSGTAWVEATPLDECEAALRATGRWKE